MGDATNKLNIYLIKAEFQEPGEVVRPETEGIELEELGWFYAENSRSKQPGWVRDFFLGKLARSFTFRTASAKGLLLVRSQGRLFALTFGHGRHLLRDGVVEERFGLKVVLNSVIPESLRSIDKTTLGSVPKQSREQMSRESEAANFGIDVEQDLLNAVTGRSKDVRLGRTISGRDSVSLSVKVDVSDVAALLPVLVETYARDDYKENFEWIDQIADVRDKTKIADLNEWLVERLRNGELDKIWMAPPVVINWVDVKGFQYSKRKGAPTFLDLAVDDFLDSLEGREINLETLKSSVVLAISSRTDEPFEQWSAHKCFYAEATIEGEVYVLNNGKWYRISVAFAEKVLADFESSPDSEIELPEYDHENEGHYNEALPDEIDGAHCMDRKLIRHGGGHSAIEFCDLLTRDKRMIHVKRYGGSAQFSHLFSQGVVAGELFLEDAEFRTKLNAELPEGMQLTDPIARPDPQEYEVVFAIISRSDDPLDIPFFSKVGFRNARRRLLGYGYKVTKRKVKSVV